jgi:hypothetical protein
MELITQRVSLDVIGSLRVLTYYVRLIRYAATAKPRIFHILWNNKFVHFDRTFLMLYYKLLGRRSCLLSPTQKQIFSPWKQNTGYISGEAKGRFCSLALSASTRVSGGRLSATRQHKREFEKYFVSDPFKHLDRRRRHIRSTRIHVAHGVLLAHSLEVTPRY